MNNKQVIANLRKHGIMAFQRENQYCINVVHESDAGAMLAELYIEHNEWSLSAEDGRELVYSGAAFKDKDHKYILKTLNEYYFYGDD